MPYDMHLGLKLNYGVEDPGLVTHTERKAKSNGQMDGQIGQIERPFQTDDPRGAWRLSADAHAWHRWSLKATMEARLTARSNSPHMVNGEWVRGCPCRVVGACVRKVRHGPIRRGGGGSDYCTTVWHTYIARALSLSLSASQNKI